MHHLIILYAVSAFFEYKIYMLQLRNFSLRNQCNLPQLRPQSKPLVAVANVSGVRQSDNIWYYLRGSLLDVLISRDLKLLTF